MQPTSPTQLTIVIPAYNEADIIQHTIETILAYTKTLSPTLSVSIIVVDDGSTDSTKKIIHSFPTVRYIGYSKNRGKGYALRYAIERVDSEYVYIADADLSVSIDQLSVFLSKKETADCIIGNRQDEQSTMTIRWHRKKMGILGNILIKRFLNLELQDTQCGFKLLNKKAQSIFLTHTTDGWGFDFDFLYRLQRAGGTVAEVPITWVAGENSKMTVRGYLRTLQELFTLWRNKKNI